MHSQRLGLIVVGAVTALVLPAGAAAASVLPRSNVGADLAALNAYRTYLSALNSTSGPAQAAVQQVADAVTSDCPGALADLNKLSATQLKKSALTSFANETDADLALAYIGPSAAALNRFGGTLSGLSWSTSPPRATTSRLIATSRALLNTPQPDLCADATTLDAAPLSEPTTTSRFLARYRTASRNLKSATTAFQTLLGKFETAAERKLVGQINTLVSQFTSQSSTFEQATATTVLSDLGIKN